METSSQTEVAHEEWRAIPGYEGLYEVSNIGRIRSLNYNRSRETKVMSHAGSSRYAGVKLSRGGSIYRCLIHVQVAAAFIGPKPDGMQVNHKNGDSFDNRVENLEYVTPSENSLHAFRLGLRKPTYGQINGMCKLTPQDVREIRQLLIQGLKPKDVALRFNIDRQTACDIGSRKRWAHLN